jgi:hypothetical protein
MDALDMYSPEIIKQVRPKARARDNSHESSSKKQQTKQMIEGLEVSFPYQPYSCQLDFMTSTIKALQNGQNALLESPTGLIVFFVLGKKIYIA